jgi:hypothetical protein
VSRLVKSIWQFFSLDLQYDSLYSPWLKSKAL